MAKNKYDAVVVGVSAGGLTALIELLGELPNNYPVPLIVVQHRAKSEKGLFEEILQSKCMIKIKQADEKETIKAGIVYIAPPDYHLLVEESKTFSLSSEAPIKASRPSIDVLFETAAETYKNRLAGIILTGANSDGTNGIIKIKKCGGKTIAQDPGEAFNSVMPQSAIDSGKIDEVMSLKEIKEFLLKIGG